jgi:hypothetical protein
MNPTMNLDDEVKTIEAASGATAFVSKLWFLLSQPQEFGEYIRWTAKGKGFILSHRECFPWFAHDLVEADAHLMLLIRLADLWSSYPVSLLPSLEREC